jgi:hypothetical protein
MIIINTFASLLYSLNNCDSIRLFKSEYNLNCKNKIIIDECYKNDGFDNYKILRIWKSKAILNYYFSDVENNIISYLFYKIYKNYIKITHIYIKNILEEKDYDDLFNSLIKYIKNKTKSIGLSKIVVETECDLIYYEKYYKPLGYELTNRICATNIYKIEIEKYI